MVDVVDTCEKRTKQITDKNEHFDRFEDEQRKINSEVTNRIT